MTLSLTVWGKEVFDHGKFSNVLYVPGLSSNLFPVYRMTQTGSPKNFIFSPDDGEITEISNGKVIAKGVVDHTLKGYMFFTFSTLLKPLCSFDSC